MRVGLLRAPVRYDGMAGPILIAMGLTIVTLAAWSVQPPAPRHPQPVIELWRTQQYRPLSVMLVPMPAPDQRP